MIDTTATNSKSAGRHQETQTAVVENADLCESSVQTDPVTIKEPVSLVQKEVQTESPKSNPVNEQQAEESYDEEDDLSRQEDPTEAENAAAAFTKQLTNLFSK